MISAPNSSCGIWIFKTTEPISAAADSVSGAAPTTSCRVPIHADPDGLPLSPGDQPADPLDAVGGCRHGAMLPAGQPPARHRASSAVPVHRDRIGGVPP